MLWDGGPALPARPAPNLLIGYRHVSFQVARTLELDSHAKPTIALSKGRVAHGGRVKITGTIPGPQAAGRVVLQASSLRVSGIAVPPPARPW